MYKWNVENYDFPNRSFAHAAAISTAVIVFCLFSAPEMNGNFRVFQFEI